MEAQLETNEISQTGKQNKKSGFKKGMILKKVDLETAKLIFNIKEKANRKSFGRKVRDGEILAMAVRLLGPEHIQELQEATFSEQDRLHITHEDYVKKHGKISLDQFIGKLIRGEITQKT